MVSTRELIISLYGAWRLARLDPRGFACFDASAEGARRSFWAAALVAPLYAVMLVAGSHGDHDDTLRYYVVETIAYSITWTAYPVLAEWLTQLLGCRERFEGYLVAYNWSMVVQNAAILPVAILAALGALPAEAAQTMWLIVFLLILVYLTFIARIALAVSPITAAGLVILDVLLSALIDAIAGGMSGGMY
jgi:hypothetical protein